MLYTISNALRDLEFYKALLIVYNTFFRARPEDGSIRGAEICCC